MSRSPGEYSVAWLPAPRLRGSRAAPGRLGGCVPHPGRILHASGSSPGTRPCFRTAPTTGLALQDSFGLHSRTSPDVLARLRPVSYCARVGQMFDHQTAFAAIILQYRGWKKAPREFWFKGARSFCVEGVLRAGSFVWESRYLYVTFAIHAAFQQKLPETLRTGPCGRTSCPAWLVRGRSVPAFCIAHGAWDWLRNRPSGSLKAAPPIRPSRYSRVNPCPTPRVGTGRSEGPYSGASRQRGLHRSPAGRPEGRAVRCVRRLSPSSYALSIRWARAPPTDVGRTPLTSTYV